MRGKGGSGRMSPISADRRVTRLVGSLCLSQNNIGGSL